MNLRYFEIIGGVNFTLMLIPPYNWVNVANFLMLLWCFQSWRAARKGGE